MDRKKKVWVLKYRYPRKLFGIRLPFFSFKKGEDIYPTESSAKDGKEFMENLGGEGEIEERWIN